MPPPCRILVVDDDPNLCRTLTLMLEHAGYAAAGSVGDRQALGCLELKDCDLILLDIMTLGPDGLDLLGWLQQCYSGVAVLVLIGEDLSGLAAELRQRGAGAILYKPFSAETLLLKVAELLRTRYPPGP
jgi:DNA-binding response OmpR family regulator